MSKWLNTSGTHKPLKLENSARSQDPQAVKINNILKVQESMHRGRDLTSWSLSARKTLGAAGGASFAVRKGNPRIHPVAKLNPNLYVAGDTWWSFEAPKLAMIVASPVVADFFKQNPEAIKFVCEGPFLKARAMEAIAYWLRISLVVQELGKIRLMHITPKLTMVDLERALDLRTAMQVLDMEQYIDHFVPTYKATLEYPPDSAMDPTKTSTVFRVPSTQEARLVLDHAIIGVRDDVVDALAFHMVVVKKKNALPAEWLKFLGDHSNLMFANAMKMGEAVFANKVKELRKQRDNARKTQGQVQQNKKVGSTDKGLLTVAATQKSNQSPVESTFVSPYSKGNLFGVLNDEASEDEDEDN